MWKIQARTHAHTHTCAYTYAHARIHIRTRAHTHTHTRAYTYAHARARAHTHTHTQHACTHNTDTIVVIFIQYGVAMSDWLNLHARKKERKKEQGIKPRKDCFILNCIACCRDSVTSQAVEDVRRYAPLLVYCDIALSGIIHDTGKRNVWHKFL